MLSEDQKGKAQRAKRGAEIESFANLSPSLTAIDELHRRYPGETPNRAIDKALERLRTLEEVFKIANVQPQ
jgi:hypothetical protein